MLVRTYPASCISSSAAPRCGVGPEMASLLTFIETVSEIGLRPSPRHVAHRSSRMLCASQGTTGVFCPVHNGLMIRSSGMTCTQAVAHIRVVSKAAAACMCSTTTTRGCTLQQPVLRHPRCKTWLSRLPQHDVWPQARLEQNRSTGVKSLAGYLLGLILVKPLRFASSCRCSWSGAGPTRGLPAWWVTCWGCPSSTMQTQH